MEGSWEAERRKEGRREAWRRKATRRRLRSKGGGTKLGEVRRAGGEGEGARPSCNGVMHSFWWSCKFHDANCTSVYLRGDLRQPVGGPGEL